MIVILDFDGVITKLDIDWEDLLSRLNLDSFIKFWKENFNTSEARIIGNRIQAEEYKASRQSKMFDDVKPSLELLKGNRLYISSMQPNLVLEDFLSRNEILNYFVEILGRDSFQDKESQIKYILSKEKDNAAVLIDDSKRNIAACSYLVRCILLDRRKSSLLDIANQLEKDSANKTPS